MVFGEEVAVAENGSGTYGRCRGEYGILALFRRAEVAVDYYQASFPPEG